MEQFNNENEELRLKLDAYWKRIELLEEESKTN